MSLIIKKIAKLFTRQEKKQILLLLIGIFFMAVVEVFAMATIMPFMMLVTNPDITHKNTFLHTIYELLAFKSEHTFLLMVGAFVFLAIVFGNLLSALMTWKTICFSYQQGQVLSQRLFKTYLNKAYEFFIIHNSSELTKNILHEVNRFVTGLLIPVMQMLVKCIVSLFILGMLFYLDPLLAIAVTLSLGGIYCLIYLYIKKRLGMWGAQASTLHAQRHKTISESFDGIKELKIANKQDYFLNKFHALSQTLAFIESKQQNAPQVTRYTLEAIAFGGIIIVVLYLTGFKRDVSQTIPLLALYAFSGYRLMPALQQIFSGLSLARYNYSALEIISQQLALEDQSTHLSSTPDMLQIKDKITVKNIVYFYPGTTKPAMNDVSLTLKMNSLVGFVGKTGSGKSTLAYILSGLLSPNEGQIYVDDVILGKTSLHALQKNIGYVPQSIFLMDETIAKNIAFGLTQEQINRSAVENAAKMANIHEFILSLPEGYETVVGEKGIRLSGGQRQRIGIARSLYHCPQLLIFDEATSALDTITEQNILNEIVNLRQSMTIVMIAHRLATVKNCDNIFLFDQGKVIGEGSYEDLSISSHLFQKMTNATG